MDFVILFGQRIRCADIVSYGAAKSSELKKASPMAFLMADGFLKGEYVLSIVLRHAAQPMLYPLDDEAEMRSAIDKLDMACGAVQ